MGLPAWQRRHRPAPAAELDAATAISAVPEVPTRSVWLVGEDAPLLAQVQRVVEAACLPCTIVPLAGIAQRSPETALAMIALGDNARQQLAAGLALDVQQRLPLVFVEDLATLMASGAAKRALWQQVKMLARRRHGSVADPAG